MKEYYVEVTYEVTRSVYVQAIDEADARIRAVKGEGRLDDVYESDHKINHIEEGEE